MDGIKRSGLIGVGGVMGYNHLTAYAKCTGYKITAICDIDEENLRLKGEKLGIPEEARFVHYEDLLDSGLVDIVDIATPDSSHCEIAMAAVKRNIPISVEKPMGMNYKEVRDVIEAANAKHLPGHVCFTWHYNNYVRLMREQVLSGKLGQIYHVYIRCIKDSGLWEGRPLEWRFDEKISASGVMGDLSSHMFDIARFLGNEFVSVNADAGIFIKERRELKGDRMLPVTTWDWCNVLAKMENGANATFQISRTAQFLPNWLMVEVYGSRGRLIYSNDCTTQTLELQTEKNEIIRLKPDARYNANQSQAFMNLVDGKTDGLEATLENACKCQAVLDAAYRSVRQGRWVDVREIVDEYQA